MITVDELKELYGVIEDKDLLGVFGKRSKATVSKWRSGGVPASIERTAREKMSATFRHAPDPVAPEPQTNLTPEQQMLLKATEGLDFADMVKLANDAIALRDPDRLKTQPAPKQVVNG